VDDSDEMVVEQRDADSDTVHEGETLYRGYVPDATVHRTRLENLVEETSIQSDR
jgi:hypothetical protein